MANVPSLAASLIVRNESETLPRCLASLAGLVDEVVVYDTGSTDATVVVAKNAGALVIRGWWDGDFAGARNRALEHVRSEWALVVDADEEVIGDAAGLRALLEMGRDSDAFTVTVHNTYPESLGGNYEHHSPRLFRTATARYRGRVHEQLESCHGARMLVSVAGHEALSIHHHGYGDEATVKAKGARNAEIGQAELAALTSGDSPDLGRVASTLLALGRSFIAVGERQNAVDTFEMLRELAPGTVEATQGGDFLARLLLADGQDEAVLVVVEELRQAKVNTQYCDWLAAQALAQLGQVTQARDLLDVISDIEDAAGRRYDPAAIEEMRVLVSDLGLAASGTD